MRVRRSAISVLLAVLALTLTLPAWTDSPLSGDSGAEARVKLLTDSRAVDVVICLDTSGSMENLLDSARARLWDVINELALMRPTPELRVGLLTFGTKNSTAERGFVEKHLDLTGDLDLVYGRLAALEIGGHEEYVGRVLDTALDEMSWASEWNALRIIFLAGNESADQDVENHDFRVVTRSARDKDIIINALYAGNREEAITMKWPEVARNGAGNFSAIDPKVGTIQIATPQDDRLLELNSLLNQTYVPYGEEGEAGLVNQVTQDSNASRLGVQSCSSRIVAKGTALYSNASWDLVDAAMSEDFSWDSLRSQDLPEELRGMSQPERVAFITSKREARESIQSEIENSSEAREQFIQKTLADNESAGLGQAMRKVIREQAMAKGFTCDDC